MAIKVGRGVLTRIREDPGYIVIQVQQPSDPDAAVRALRAAASEIAALDGGWRSAPNLDAGDTNGPKYVSELLATTAGPFITIDGGSTPASLLRTIPAIVARHLEEAGVTDGVVGCPPDSSIALRLVGPAVVLRASRPPLGLRDDRTVPGEWLAEGLAWLTEGRSECEELWGEIGAVEFSLTSAEAPALFEQCRNLRASVMLATARPSSRRRTRPRPEWGDDQLRAYAVDRLGDRLRAMRFWAVGARPYLDGAGVALAAAGPGFGWEELRDIAAGFQERARRWAPELAHAAVGAAANLDAVRRPDSDILLDAFDLDPWQILGPGHLARLVRRPVGRQLPGGRLEVALGDLDDSLPPIQERARDSVRPCLLYTEQAAAAAAEAKGRSVRPWQPSLAKPVGIGGEQRPLPLPPGRMIWGLCPAVVLELFSLLYLGQPPSVVVDQVSEWMQAGGGDLWVTARGDYSPILGHLGHPVTPDELRALLRANFNGTDGILVAVDPDGLIRRVCAGQKRRTPVPAPGMHIEMAVGRPHEQRPARPTATSYTKMLGLLGEAEEIARALSPELTYAYATVLAAEGHLPWSWRAQGGANPFGMRILWDEYVPDAFPYQILTSAHVARLEASPPGLNALGLGGERHELKLGDPLSWLMPCRLETLDELAPCLVSAEEADRLDTTRRAGTEVARGGLMQVLNAMACAGGPLDALPAVTRAVALRLYPASSSSPPAVLLEDAVRWLCEGVDDQTEAVAAIEDHLQFGLRVADADTFFRRVWARYASSALMVRGDLAHCVMLAKVHFSREPSVVLAAGGPDLDGADVLDLVERLTQIARRISATIPLHYAFVAIEPTLGPCLQVVHSTEWVSPGPPDWATTSNRWAESVPDAFTYQILGPGHLGAWCEVGHVA